MDDLFGLADSRPRFIDVRNIRLDAMIAVQTPGILQGGNQIALPDSTRNIDDRVAWVEA